MGVLKPLADATEILTTESTPAAGAVYPLLKELCVDLTVYAAPESDEDGGGDADDDNLRLPPDPMGSDTELPGDGDEEAHESEMTAPEPGLTAGSGAESEEEDESCYDSVVIAALKNLIWSRLRSRFDLEEDGQPVDSVCRTCPLLIAAFCDPRYYSCWLF